MIKDEICYQEKSNHRCNFDEMQHSEKVLKAGNSSAFNINSYSDNTIQKHTSYHKKITLDI